MYKILINFICLFIIIGCQKEDAVEQTPSNNFPVEDNGVIWQTPTKNDLSYSRSIDPILLEDGILVSTSTSGVNESVKKFEKDSGNLLWEWNDYITVTSGQKLRGHQRTLVSNNILIGSSQQDHYGIDIATGDSEWSTLVDYRGSRISSFGESYFSTISYGNNAYSDSATINMCNIYSGDCKEVIKFYKDGDFEPHLHGPVAILNSNNDTLIIFQNREYAYLTSNEIRVNYHCYNMTQKAMEWEHLDAEIWDNANIRAPLIDGDYCYFVGLASAYCFNINTGEKVWQYDHDVAWQLSNFLIHENNFIIKDDQSNLLAINKNSGQLSWKNEDASGCCVTMRLYGDRIYFANSGLFIVDARNGKMLYRDLESPNKEEYPGAVFSNTVAVDLEERIMYATDGYFVMAMELPE